jgi:hypothetical protein
VFGKSEGEIFKDKTGLLAYFLKVYAMICYISNLITNKIYED